MSAGEAVMTTNYDNPLFQPLTDVPMDRQIYELNEELVELQKQLNSTLKALEASQKARAALWDALYKLHDPEYCYCFQGWAGEALALGDGRVK